MQENLKSNQESINLNNEIIRKKAANKKMKILNFIFIIAVFTGLAIYMIYIDGMDNIIELLHSVDYKWVLAGVGCLLVHWLCDSLNLYIPIKRMYPTQTFKNSFKVAMIGQLFNNITPFATGGQPMQAYYLVKFGVPLGCGITALLSRFIVYQFVLTGYSIFTLAVGYKHFGDDLQQKGLMPFVLIGFIINTAVIVALIAIALFRKGTLKFANWLISLLTRMHIVKRPIKWRVYFTREVNKFYNNFKYLKKNIPLLLKSVFFTFIQLTLFLSISYVLYRGFGLEGTSLLQIISYQAYVLMISSFIPLPGAMGGAELGYHGFFKDIFGEHYVNTAMMLWRIMTFYLPIIVGLFFTLTMKNKGIEEPQDGETEKMLYDMEQQTENDPEIK